MINLGIYRFVMNPFGQVRYYLSTNIFFNWEGLGKHMGLLLSLIAGLQLLNPSIPGQDSSLVQDSTLAQARKDSNRIEIEHKIRRDYGLDSLKINFEVLPGDSPIPFLGAYSPWCDSLIINYDKIMKFSERGSLNPDSILKKIMKHELRHYKTDKMQEEFGQKSIVENAYSRELIALYVDLLQISEKEKGLSTVLFQSFVRKGGKDLTDIILDRMINEGISMYYDNPNFEPTVTAWPSSIRGIKSYEEYDRAIYYVGWDLMYPIISNHGEEGIEYVIKNMPKYEDFYDLKAYQKRIMKELEERKKK
jgi:hypothetical protein